MEREPSVTNFGHYEITTSSDGKAVLRFGSGHGHVPTALSDVATFLKHEGVRLDRVEDATIALAEALNNIEEHAYAGRPDLPVLLRIMTNPKGLKCEIEDQGQPLPGGSVPVSSMPKTNPVAHEEWPEGGFGWALLRRLTSDLCYCRHEDRNTLSFTIP
jgi:serine/threonine-protein kinase RsbW